LTRAELDSTQSGSVEAARSGLPTEPAAPPTSRTLTVLRRSAVLVWALALLYWVHRVGLTFDRNTLLIYICTGLVAASIGRRGVLSVLRDWLPFAAILVAYDLTRGAAEALGRPTEWHIPLDFDRWLFGGTEPTVWLQSHLKEPFPPWWEILVSLIYVSYFFAPCVIAGVLWLRDRAAWRRFAFRFVTISFIGLIGFVCVPAAPPWAAAQCGTAQVAGGPSDPECIQATVGTVTDGGMLGKVHPRHAGAAPYIERVASRGWNKIGIPQAKALVDEGQAGANEVAAVPSLHAAISSLLTVFFWRRVRRRWRPLLAGYAIAMGFSLVYGAEHYVFDILLGWLLTGVVSYAFSRWEAQRARQRGPAGTAADRTDTDGAGNGVGPPDTLKGSLVPRP
jgi:hypothetical protein